MQNPTQSTGPAHSWVTKPVLRTVAERVGTPVFIYSASRLVENVRRIHDAAASAGIEDRLELYVPFFPNSNPHVHKPLQTLGVGMLLQLPSEYRILRQHGFDKFIVSPGHVSNSEISFWAQQGLPVFLSSLEEIDHFLSVSPGAPLNVRFDSLSSGKPGLKYSQLATLATLLEDTGTQLDCFEVYCGSGHSVEEMVSILEQVFMVFKTYFPAARSINLAGGYGFAYEEWDESKKHFDWGRYLMELSALARRYDVPEHVRFLFEPARDLLADAAVLLLGIKREIIKNPGAYMILTDGSRVLMPSAQYKERRHNVRFLDASMEEMPAAGPYAALRGRAILRHDYVLPGQYRAPESVTSGDYLVVHDVGAYCATQHMEFLNIPPAAEVVLDTDGTPSLVTSHGDELDKWRHVLPEGRELPGLSAMPKRFSTKELHVVRDPSPDEPGVGIFTFTDDYSVFHYGKMPDAIPGKGESTARMAAFNLRLLEQAGVPTHFRRFLPPDRIEFTLLRAPDRMPPDEVNYMIPLQVVFRNALPAGASVFRRLKEGSATLAQLGLRDSPRVGQPLDPPLIEFTTKREEIDRFIDEQEARSVGGLEARDVARIRELVLLVDRTITEHAREVGLHHADGKVEFGMLGRGEIILVDHAGTPDENRFMLGGRHVGKQLMRDWYLAHGLERAVQDWARDGRPRSSSPRPDPLPRGFLHPLSDMYRSLCERWTGETVWGAPPLEECLEAVRRESAEGGALLMSAGLRPQEPRC